MIAKLYITYFNGRVVKYGLQFWNYFNFILIQENPPNYSDIIYLYTLI